eukprot:3256317-Karenia_brevis.AAC.1
MAAEVFHDDDFESQLRESLQDSAIESRDYPPCEIDDGPRRPGYGWWTPEDYEPSIEDDLAYRDYQKNYEPFDNFLENSENELQTYVGTSSSSGPMPVEPE